MAVQSLESEDDSRKGITMLELLRQFQSSECSDARDRVYALAGLAKDVNLVWAKEAAETDSQGTMSIVVDYSKTVEEVYVDIGLAMARIDGSSPITSWHSWEGNEMLRLGMRRSTG